MQSTSVEPRIGVVVLHHRNWPGVADTLTDVLAQTVAPDVVLVDNGSGIAGLEDEMRERFPAIEIVMLTKNLGYAGGMNVGAQHLEHVDHLALVTHECRLSERTLETMRDRLRSHEDVGMVGPVLVSKRSGRLDSAGGLLNSRLVPRHRLRHADPTAAPRDPVPADWLDGAAVVIRGDAWRSVGGLDESYFLYGEDVDLGIRLRKLGWAIEVVPQAVVTEESSGSRPGYWQIREHLRRLILHGTKRQLAQEFTFIGRRAFRSLLAMVKWSIARDRTRVRNHGELLKETYRATRDGIRGGPPRPST